MARLALLFWPLLFWGCAHKPGAVPEDPWEPNPSDAQRRGVSLKSLQEGLSLYRSNCGGCHMLYPVQQFTAQQWPQWVDEMQERARLDESNSTAIKNYLVALASRKAAAASQPPTSPNQE